MNDDPVSHPLVAKEADRKAGRDTQPGKKRLLLVASVVLGILAGTPIWWKTTELHRAPLPFSAIKSHIASQADDPLALPRHLHVVIAVPDLESANPLLNLGIDNLAAATWHEIVRLLSIREKNQSPHSVLSTQFTLTWGGGACLSSLPLIQRTDNRSLSKEDIRSVQSGAKAVAPWICSLGGPDLPAQSALLDEQDFDDWLLEAGARNVSYAASAAHKGGRYFLILALNRGRAAAKGSAKVFVGKHRHAWAFLEAAAEGEEMSKERVVALAAKVFTMYFERGGREEEAGERELPLASDGSVLLSFSLLNAAPCQGWLFDWDFVGAEHALLSGLVRAVAPVANLRIESQVLYHAKADVAPTWHAKLGAHVVQEADLPFFANAHQWHLDTSAAAAGRSRLLHFAVYVPPPSECPLLILQADGSPLPSNGFTIPGWGGVVVFNPPGCSGANATANANPPAGKFQKLSVEDLRPVMATVVAQFRQLFGLPAVPPLTAEANGGEIVALQSPTTGICAWEVDVLLRRRATADSVAAASTLSSFSSLVQSMESIVIADIIGLQVSSALASAADARRHAATGSYEETAEAAGKAKADADDAFFHPSIISLLYFPREHYFAIYVPFFLPVLVHVGVAAAKEFVRYYKERKKYATFLNSRT